MCERCKLRHQLIVKLANKKYKDIILGRIIKCCGFDDKYVPIKENKKVETPF